MKSTTDGGQHHQNFEQIERLRPNLCIYLVCKFHSLPPDLIQDAIQEAFISISKKLAINTTILNIQAYTYRVAVNRCIDQIRARKNELSLDLADGLEPADGVRTDEEVLDGIRVDELLGSLTEYEQMIVRMYVMDGYTYRQIRTFLLQSATWSQTGVSEAQICRNIHRALDKLREKLEKEA